MAQLEPCPGQASQNGTGVSEPRSPLSELPACSSAWTAKPLLPAQASDGCAPTQLRPMDETHGSSKKKLAGSARNGGPSSCSLPARVFLSVANCNSGTTCQRAPGRGRRRLPAPRPAHVRPGRTAPRRSRAMAARRALGLRRMAAARLAAEEANVETPEEVERRLRRQETAIRLRRMQRLMEPPGPPKRTLSRQAMEQIRFLSQEFPDDWPVSRLAQGFQVNPDAIRRVLRSRFSPSLERGLKQDRQVWAEQSGGLPTGPGSQQPQALLTRDSTFKLLPARAGAPQIVPRKDCVAPLDRPEAGRQQRAGKCQDVPAGATQVEEERRQERFLRKEELEQLAAEGWESNLRVVQRGKEFFDEAGNLLYRIPTPPGD